MFSLFSQMTWVDCLTITSQHHQSSICHSFPYSTTLPSYLVPRQHSHNLLPTSGPSRGGASAWHGRGGSWHGRCAGHVGAPLRGHAAPGHGGHRHAAVRGALGLEHAGLEAELGGGVLHQRVEAVAGAVVPPHHLIGSRANKVVGLTTHHLLWTAVVTIWSFRRNK